MAMQDGRGVGGEPVERIRFSASEATFTGLRLLTREPRTWLIWGALCLAFSLAVGAVTVVTFGPVMTELMAMPRTPSPDPAATMALMGRMAPFQGLMLVVSLLFDAVAFGAVNRAVLRPVTTRTAHLALGGDELRQLLVLILIGLVFLGVYIAAVIAGIVVGIVAALAAGAAHVGSGAGVAGPVVAVTFIVVLLILATLLFVMVRLSLASPLAFDTGRIDLGASWRMTRGRFWPLLGAYLLAALIVFVLLLAAALIFAAIAIATGGGLAGAALLFKPNMSSLATYFAPLQLVWLIMNSVLAPLWLAIMIGAPAGAYAQLRGLTPPIASGTSTAPASDLPRFGR